MACIRPDLAYVGGGPNAVFKSWRSCRLAESFCFRCTPSIQCKESAIELPVLLGYLTGISQVSQGFDYKKQHWIEIVLCQMTAYIHNWRHFKFWASFSSHTFLGVCGNFPHRLFRTPRGNEWTSYLREIMATVAGRFQKHPTLLPGPQHHAALFHSPAEHCSAMVINWDAPSACFC